MYGAMLYNNILIQPCIIKIVLVQCEVQSTVKPRYLYGH